MTHFDVAAAASYCIYQKLHTQLYAEHWLLPWTPSWYLKLREADISHIPCILNPITHFEVPAASPQWCYPKLHMHLTDEHCLLPQMPWGNESSSKYYYYFHEPDILCIPCIPNPVSTLMLPKLHRSDVTQNCIRKCMLSIVCSPGRQEAIFQIPWTRYPKNCVSLNLWPALMLPKPPSVPCSPNPMTRNCVRSCMLSIVCSPGCQEPIFHVPGAQFPKSCDPLWCCWSSHVSHVFRDPWPKNCICRCMTCIVCAPRCQEAIFHFLGTLYPKTHADHCYPCRRCAFHRHHCCCSHFTVALFIAIAIVFLLSWPLLS